MTSIRNFLNQRKGIISVRIIGVIGHIVLLLDLIPLSEQVCNSFAYLVIEFAFISMMFYKVDVKKIDIKIRILVAALILLIGGLGVYFRYFR